MKRFLTIVIVLLSSMLTVSCSTDTTMKEDKAVQVEINSSGEVSSFEELQTAFPNVNFDRLQPAAENVEKAGISFVVKGKDKTVATEWLSQFGELTNVVDNSGKKIEGKFTMSLPQEDAQYLVIDYVEKDENFTLSLYLV
jgi:hypothetical protein